ncbi:MAG: 1-acyl-sn-glycerol-3-phosphate acyltransferase [Chloroflexi bacterium]|nr:1-acyl-sn-glycerol-3-phosphate acyltransferase [Chloroflexota bacterium]
MKPPYHLPYLLVLPRLPSFLLGQRRSLSHDLQLIFNATGNAPRAIGAEHIPTRGGFVLVMNHYHRQDIPAWWTALAAFAPLAKRRASLASADVRLLVASQWTYDNHWQRALVEPLTRFVIGRIAHTYNFLTIEPNALGRAQANERAASMRHVLAAAKDARRQEQVIGLAPEGGDSADGALMALPEGAGRFMLLLAATGLPFLPVGVCAESNTLVARYGEPFQLSTPPGLAKAKLDAWAAREVMTRIAALLPPELRGAYA